ncbi:helix-turn-helix domain-containing protein [Amycolatopsis plumensis]|uniref:Helix-turn-helix domain-containing protein n=1 Tax=Amycolatopsis plumensis TaxID=236508 RepID=A0ABV5U0T2_9PSEU
MGVPGADDELAGRLAELKDRSGLSYAELGRRTHSSSSTLHRYCTGKTVPPDYQTVVRIAAACEATDVDLVDLLRHWRRAVDPDAVPPAANQISFPKKRRRMPGLARVVAVLSAVALLVTAAGVPRTVHTGAAQRIDGPSWQKENPVDPRLFGVTASSRSGSMPAFRVGSLRFWDSGTRWASLQPEPGVYDWTVLDRLVAGAEHAGLPATLVFGGTPAWAAPHGPKSPYGDGARSAPPDDLTAWDRFVRTLVTRYRGRIEAYEVWVHANDVRYYSGSTETLVEMTRRASRIIKAADPEAVVVCPSIAGLWTDEGRRVLRRFAELRGYDHCDVAGLNLHQRHALDPPETMVDLLGQVDHALHDAGVHPTLWNTGVTYEYVLEDALDDRRAVDYATRFYLVALYGSNFSLARTYFYNWGSTRLPIVLQGVGGPPTRAALAVEELQRWLSHTTSRSCGHGVAIGLPANVWQCEFTTPDHRLLVIRWTHHGTAKTTAAPHAEEVRQLDGTGSPLHPGDTIEVSETPVLIVYRTP